MTATFDPAAIEQAAEAWPPQLERISFSSLNQFIRCPEQFRRVRIMGERQRPAAAMAWGSADTDAVAFGLEPRVGFIVDTATAAVMLERELPLRPTADVQDRFADRWQQELDNAGGEMEKLHVDVEDGKATKVSKTEAKKRAAEIKDSGTRLVAAYHEQVSPGVWPTALEQPFEVAPAPGVPVKLIGYMDVVEPGRIIERKTAGRTNTVPSPEWTLQGLIYRLGWPGLPLEWHQSVKNKVPKIITPHATWEGGKLLAGTETPGMRATPLKGAELRTAQRAVWQTVAAIGFYAARYGLEGPWPGAKFHGFNWGGHPCGFCGFRATCPWWQT